MKAYDLLVQAESGLASVTGSPDAPGRVGVSVCDIAAGLNAVIGIQQALLARERTGRGDGVEVSLFDAMADWMTVPLLYGLHAEPPRRVGLRHPTIAPYGAYPIGDGGEIVICIQNPREWVRFCEDVLERPELADDPMFADNMARVRNRAALDEHIERVFRRFDRTGLERRLRDGGIAYGAVNDVEALSRHPQLRMWPLPSASGEARLVAPPVRTGEDGERFATVPALGEHDAAIRRELAED